MNILIAGSSPSETNNRGDEAVFNTFCEGMRQEFPGVDLVFYKVTFRRAKPPLDKIRSTSLVDTNFENADLTYCSILGISAWNFIS